MELPKRKKNRLDHYDYSNPNAYFITICTCSRKNLFWKDAPSKAVDSYIPLLTPIGRIAEQGILAIPYHYSAISVDCYTVMPNHVHILLQIHSGIDGQSLTVPSISSVINQMKGAVTKKAGFSIWQKGFHDHVVRSYADYLDIWNYIEGNPNKWAEDHLCNDTLV